MKKWTLFILTLIFSGIGSYCVYLVYMNSYVKYTPITNYGDDFLEEPELNTELHKENLGMVLDDNNVEWRYRNGEIYIKRKWVLDKRMVVNYTNKANEAEYVRYVPVVLKDPNTGYVVVPELQIDIENLKLVLDSYQEKWMEQNGELYITKRLALDKEMVHNYTQKANDDKFVEQLK